MQQANRDNLYTLVPQDSLKNIGINPPSQNFTIHNLPHCLMIEFQLYYNEKEHVIDWLEDQGFIKFFENYWLPDLWHTKESINFMEDFFSFIAPTYENHIHKNNNIASYEFLINKALSLKNTLNSKFLDFGCGTGVIIETTSISKIDSLTGYDFSHNMRVIAKSKGLSTLSENAFNLLEKEQFDAILLNYVLHFDIDIYTLNKLLDFLLNGGVLIGNIHKDLGLNDFKHWLDSLPKNKYFYKVINSQFGSIIIINKRT